MRVASWSADISRLKKATGAPALLAGSIPSSLVADEALGGRERHVGGERGLAHAGAAGEDDEVALVHAADLGVDPVEAGGDAATDGRRC